MSGKIQVPADLQEICILFEDSSCEHRGYLDLKTGEIVQIFDDIMDPDEKEELDDKVDEGLGERYIAIPNAESYDGYKDMENFIETVKEVKLKEKLYNAITRKGAFRRFKDVLTFYPKERERWFKFKRKGFGARGCLKCDSEDGFKERYFVISRCPESEEEEHWLDETMKKKYGVKQHGITAGIFNDSRGLINSAVCGKCGSHDIFFDF